MVALFLSARCLLWMKFEALKRRWCFGFCTIWDTLGIQKPYRLLSRVRFGISSYFALLALFDGRLSSPLINLSKRAIYNVMVYFFVWNMERIKRANYSSVRRIRSIFHTKKYTIPL